MQLLDVDDAVAQKAIELLARDTFTRARRRKLAVDAVTGSGSRNYHHHSTQHRSISARNETSAQQRQHRERRQAEAEAEEYDAIIAAAQRRVLSPLPYPLREGSGRTSQASAWDTTSFGQQGWTGISNAVSGNNEGHVSEGDDWYADITDESGNEEVAENRIFGVGRSLARAQRHRDATMSISGAASENGGTGLPSSTAARHAIIERLERRRRERAERGQQGPNYHTLRPLSSSSTAGQEDHDSNPRSIDSTSSVPIIVGGDFSELPTSVTRSNDNTLRASYASSLQRGTSIRRSGFHSNVLSSSILPRVPRVRNDQQPVHSQPEPRSALTPSRNDDSVRSTLRGISSTDSASAAPNFSSSYLSPSELSHRAAAFEDFARISRQTFRENLDEADNGDDEYPQSYSDAALERFLFPQAADPMLASSSTDAETVSEMLGSSSSAAALGGTSTALSSTGPTQGRTLSPPGAPIISRRPFPYGLPPPLPPSQPFDAVNIRTESSNATESISQPIVLRWPSVSDALDPVPPAMVDGPVEPSDDGLSLADFLQ